MAKEIQLTKNKVAIVDDEDFEYLNQWKWSTNAANPRRFYAWRNKRIEGKVNMIYLHRFILNITDRKIHVDHIMIYHPAIKRVKNLIDNGDMGNLIYFDSSRMNLGKIKNDVSAMWDLAVHDIAIIDFLIGGKIFKEVSALGQNYWSQKESLTFLGIKYDGFIAHLKSSWVSPVKERRMIIAGEKKMIVFDDMLLTDKMIIYDKGFELEDKDTSVEYSEYALQVREGDAVIPFLPYEDALRNSIEHFVMSVRNNTESFSGPDQAIRVIKILEEADKKLKMQ